MEVDKNTAMFVTVLRDLYTNEPEQVDLDKHDGHHLAEVALKHYNWERQVEGLRLLIGVRLTNIALEDG